MAVSSEVLSTCGLSKEEADALLSQLSEHVSEALTQEEMVAVEGVGTFKRNGGELQFTPDKSLLATVNYRYESLPILDVTGTVVTTDERTSEAEMSELSVMEDSDVLPVATPVSSTKQPAEPQSPTSESPAPELEGAAPPVAATVIKSPKKTMPRSAKRETATMGIVAAILIVVALVVFVLTLLNPSDPGTQETADHGTLQEIILEKENTIAGNWGLSGTVDGSLKEYYTIVLFSLRNRENAYQMRENLSQRGLRALVQEVEINQQRAFRVAVGQFPDTGMAQDSAGLLPDDLRTSYFLRKIQTQ